jgi:hypothetical protein
MIRTVITSLLLFTSTLARAQGSGIGLGVLIGEPTGISVKAWIGADRAIDGGMAWSFSHNGYFHLHGDLLFHKMDLIPVPKGKLPLYFGPGLRFRSWGNDGYYHKGRYYEDGNGHVDLGIRFPVGLAYLFDGAPVDAFLEVAPTLDLIPATSLDVDGGIGARYWF